METAARATSSSARASSSLSKGSGLSARQKLTTPRMRAPARSGTVISEWMPYSTTCAVRSGSWVSQPGASLSRGSTTASPVSRLRACGEDAMNWICLPTG